MMQKLASLKNEVKNNYIRKALVKIVISGKVSSGGWKIYSIICAYSTLHLDASRNVSFLRYCFMEAMLLSPYYWCCENPPVH